MQACLFPLRTNAGFYRQRGYFSLKQRLKEAALLYDNLLLEAGSFTAHIGPRTSFESLEARGIELAYVRGPSSRGGTFGFSIRDEKTGHGLQIVDEPLHRRFAAEFTSLLEEFLSETGLSELPSWIQSEPWEISIEPRRHVDHMAREDAKNGVLAKESPRIRAFALEALNHDLLLGALLGADVSADAYFARAIAQKRGVQGAAGSFAFRVIVPHFGQLSWPAISEFREHPGLHDFRRKMREVEETELWKARSELDAREVVHRRIQYDLSQLVRRQRGLEIVGNAAVEFALNSLPVPVGTIVSVAGELVEAEQMNRSWVAFFRDAWR